jgi:hypothetical protein
VSLFRAKFSRTLPNDVHAVLVLDRADWHGAKAREVPATITLVLLPPYIQNSTCRSSGTFERI